MDCSPGTVFGCDSISPPKVISPPGRTAHFNEHPSKDGMGVKVRRTVAGTDKLARSLNVLLFVMEAAGIPEYSCKKSNRIFSYRQKIALLVLWRINRDVESVIEGFRVA